MAGDRPSAPVAGGPAPPAGGRAVLHVGLPKTGTSGLQDRCIAHRDALQAAGVTLFPQRPRDHFQAALAVRGLVREFDSPEAAGVLDRMRAELPTVTTADLLLSQEALAPTRPDQARVLRDLLADRELHVVITVRDLARQLPSAWQQRIKSRHTYTWPEFLEAARTRDPLVRDFWANQDLPQVVDRWSQVAGPARVHVVTVPPPGTPPELLVARFCRVLRVAPEVLAGTGGDANPAIGEDQAELLRRVNLALGDRLPHPRAGYGRVGKRYLAEQVLRAQGGTPVRVPQEYRPWLAELTAQWQEHLATSGVDLVGDPADLDPPDAAFVAGASPPEDAALLGVATHAIADMLADRETLLTERATLRRERDEARRERDQATRQRDQAREESPGPGRLATRLRQRARDRVRASPRLRGPARRVRDATRRVRRR